MTSSNPWVRALTGLLLAGGMTFAAVPMASADPAEPNSDDPSSAGTVVELPGTSAVPVNDDAASPIVDACKQFSSALNYAAANYEDFAYNTAGGGDSVNYQDGSVVSANSTGRTALRQAAAVSLQAASTPGLPQDISAPMQAWSLRAAKLVLVMGLHGGGDTLNNTASDMNTDAREVQMACAKAGTVV